MTHKKQQKKMIFESSIEIFKYQANGNHFVICWSKEMINAGKDPDRPGKNWIKKICHPQFGVGAAWQRFVQGKTRADFAHWQYQLTSPVSDPDAKQ